MYENAKTWNPFVGCQFLCSYCKKSFQRQIKRSARGCQQCIDYFPHKHMERIKKIPSSPIVFVCGTSDVYFCNETYFWSILYHIMEHKPRIKKTYYFQSKHPIYFKNFLKWFKLHEDKSILLTTLETNRDEGYNKISNAPPPSQRFKEFYDLDYSRKVVTIEPILDFDLDEFSEMIIKLHEQGTLEYVWIGYDSKNCGLREPSEQKVQELVDILQAHGIEVRGKTLRGVKLRVI
jgi:DNA repair photolyase